MPFQSAVAVTPGIGLPGDFASTNPRRHLVSGATDQPMLADESGVQMGMFAILLPGGLVDQVPAVQDVTLDNIGFVHRVVGAAYITTWLDETSNVIPPGRPVELFNAGDFFARADSVGETPVRGASVLWNPSAGTIAIGGTVGASQFDTGFKLLSDTAEAGQIVMIGRSI